MSGIEKRRQAAKREPSENYEERRRALLTAAAHVFQAKGYQAVRMDDVAEQLNVDRASLYYYFGNKQQLYREVIIESAAENVAVARSILESDNPARQKLSDLLIALMDDYERTYPLLFVYIQEDMRQIANEDAPESAELFKLGVSYQDIVKQIVQQGIDEGEFAPTRNASMVSYAVIGAANWAHRWYRPDGTLTGAEIGAEFAEVFLDGLLVGPARRRAREKRIVALPPTADRPAGQPQRSLNGSEAHSPKPRVATAPARKSGRAKTVRLVKGQASD